MRIRRRWAIPVVVSLAVLGAACGRGSDDSGGGTGSGEGDETYRFAVVLQDLTNPAIQDIQNGIQAEAANFPNITVEIQGSKGPEEQIAKAETFIAQGVDVLGIEAFSAVLLPTLQKAKDAGIPVFLVQDDAPGAVDDGLAVTYIAADEVEGGRLVGEWLLSQLPAGDVAVIKGHAGDTPSENREEGFTEALSGSDLDIVAVDYGEWSRDGGLQVATDMLTAQPDLKAIFAVNDEMAFGAIEAMRAANRVNEIILIGYNGTCSGIGATVQGDFQADGILFLDDVGRLFVQNAVAHLNGENVEPRILASVVALGTDDLNAILDGSQSTDLPGLTERIEAAAAAGGNC